MKIYIVTDGEYSGYHIEKVFTDPVKARLYQILNFPYGNIESFNIDNDITIEANQFVVFYDFRDDCIDKIELNTNGEERIDCTRYIFSIGMGDKKIYGNIISKGTNSKVILKIARDRFAKWLYENSTSREELIKIAKNKAAQNILFPRVSSPLVFVSSSSNIPAVEIPTNIAASYKLDCILRQKIDAGEELPSEDEINELYASIYNEIKGGVKESNE